MFEDRSIKEEITSKEIYTVTGMETQRIGNGTFHSECNVI